MRRFGQRESHDRVSEVCAVISAEDISNLGLKSLSTKIADLRDLVTLPSPYSPFTSTSTLRAPPSPHSPVPEHSRLSSASGHLLASARSFTRTSSAPASSAYFNTFHSLPGAINRAPSDLRADPAPPGSPTLTETSEDGADDRPANPRGLLASPSLPVPRNAISGASQTRLRSFGRSKTGAVHPSPGAGPGRLSAKDICIYAGLNALSS
jgi:hypothetical protein